MSNFRLTRLLWIHTVKTFIGCLNSEHKLSVLWRGMRGKEGQRQIKEKVDPCLHCGRYCTNTHNSGGLQHASVSRYRTRAISTELPPLSMATHLSPAEESSHLMVFYLRPCLSEKFHLETVNCAFSLLFKWRYVEVLLWPNEIFLVSLNWYVVIF